MSILASFWKPEACGQTVLPDTSVLMGQKWWKMSKFKNSNATIWVILNNVQTFGCRKIHTWTWRSVKHNLLPCPRFFKIRWIVYSHVFHPYFRWFTWHPATPRFALVLKLESQRWWFWLKAGILLELSSRESSSFSWFLVPARRW